MTNLWCFLTKSFSLDILWALKPKKEITKIENETCVFLGLKRAIGLKTCFGGAFDKLLVFVYQKYHTSDTLGTKTQKGDYKDQKPNLRSFKWLKRAIGLKTCFRGAFDKFLVSVDQK